MSDTHEEAAARALCDARNMPWEQATTGSQKFYRDLALSVVPTVAPIIEAAALERAAKVADIWAKTVAVPEKSSNPSTAHAIAAICADTGQKIAAAIRALKDEP